LPRWRKLKELLDVSPSPFLLFLSARFDFLDSSSRSRYIWSSPIEKWCLLPSVLPLGFRYLRINTKKICFNIFLKAPFKPVIRSNQSLLKSTVQTSHSKLTPPLTLQPVWTLLYIFNNVGWCCNILDYLYV
jgi:hypothetical protein